ncbi:hypothetical protein [Methanosarcina sp. WH1]|uniref:hypothetical protein n=1 Tax=Methanosarcina sp. WH1 TaxID=1434102 RepID=UPI001E2CA373|nr:hypothetical protein [Methanosarcina sp. WH1]
MDVAKETADIVLLEKDLDALVEGVKEGRKTFANTRSMSLWLPVPILGICSVWQKHPFFAFPSPAFQADPANQFID